jgi:lipopolysaccharide transport system ATP-binding protein
MIDDYALKVEHLTKDYRLYSHPRDRVFELIFRRKRGQRFRALDDVTFSLRRGEVAGVLGRNGAGKSTLLKLITGVLAPDYGRVQVQGSVSSILELGAGINPEYSGKENARLGALARGVALHRLDATVNEVCNFSELQSVIDHPLKTYSSGMQARLLFSTAIAAEADVMIIDEALAAGDALFQEKCLHRLRKLANSGRTILFVSHSIDMVQQLCNRAMLLDRGRLVADGDVSTVSHEYHELLARERAATLASEANVLRTDGDVDIGDTSLDGVIAGLAIHDSEGAAVSQLENGKRYRVILQVRANARIDHAYIGVRFYMPSGLVLFATSNSMLGLDLSLDAGDRVEVSFDVVCRLQTGVYLVGCGLGRLTDVSAGLYPAPLQPIHLRNGVREVLVTSSKHFGGLFDMDASCVVTRAASKSSEGLTQCQVIS